VLLHLGSVEFVQFGMQPGSSGVSVQFGFGGCGQLGSFGVSVQFGFGGCGQLGSFGVSVQFGLGGGVGGTGANSKRSYMN